MLGPKNHMNQEKCPWPIKQQVPIFELFNVHCKYPIIEKLSFAHNALDDDIH